MPPRHESAGALRGALARQERAHCAGRQKSPMRTRRRIACVTAVLALACTVVGTAFTSAALAAPAPDAAATVAGTSVSSALPTWRNLYDWTAGHGHVGWNSFTSDTDPAAYAFAKGRAEGPGLWLWPTGEDRTYAPPARAEWRYQAPGTTRALSVDVELDYAPRLLSNHCVNLILRDADGVTRASSGFCNTPGDHSNGARPITHLSVADPSPDSPLAKQVAIGFSVKCDKPEPSECAKNISNANADQDGVHIRKVDMTLVDDDQPVPAPTGEWFDLRDKYVNGNATHGVTMAASDDGSGITRVGVEELGVGELDHRESFCDATHHTPELNNRLCPVSLSSPTTIDARPLAEGKHTYRENAQDVAGNVGASDPWVVYIDRTPPPAPHDFNVDIDQDDTTAIVGWAQDADPDLIDGSPGSGVASWQSRFRPAGGDWSAWTTSTDDQIAIPNANPGQTFDIEVNAQDAVGNTSEVASATVVVPDLRSFYSSLSPLGEGSADGDVVVSDGSAGASGQAASVSTSPADGNQPCGPGQAVGKAATFGVQTTRTPAVTWGWFINFDIARRISSEAPFLLLRFTNETTVNGRDETGPGPHDVGPFYVYHSSIKNLHRGRRLKFGDKVHIENFVNGAGKTLDGGDIVVDGHLDFFCTVRR